MEDFKAADDGHRSAAAPVPSHHFFQQHSSAVVQHNHQPQRVGVSYSQPGLPQPVTGDADEDEGNDDDDEGDEDYRDVTLAGDDVGDVAVGVVEGAPPGRRKPKGRGKYLKPKPLQEVLTRVITALIRRDTYAFFTDPVNLAEVPTYANVIKDPLDFGTIKERVDAEGYSDVESFRSDVELVFKNAKIFNPPDTIYFSEAERIETWFRKKIAMEGPSAILPDKSTVKPKPDGTGRTSIMKGEDDGDDDMGADDSGNDDGQQLAARSAAGSQRGARTASPEASRPVNKKRKLNGGDVSLASLLSSSGNSVGLPGPNTAFAKAVASASITQARWRLMASGANQVAQRDAQAPVRPSVESALLQDLLQGPTGPTSNVAQPSLESTSQRHAPIVAPLPSAVDESILPINPLQGQRKMQFHPDGSIKIPGFTTAAQGWPDTAEAFAMNILPPSNHLYTQLGLPIPPPRLRALYPLQPLPAPADASSSATGKTLPVPLTVGGTSALNAGVNLASASFAAAQQTPWTGAGNPFPNIRPESSVLRAASSAACVMPHPVPLNATFSHEVGMQTNGGQSTFAPGQGADGGPWAVPSGGPDHDPERVGRSQADAADAKVEDPSSVEGSWWDAGVRQSSSRPGRWAAPGMVPFPAHPNGTNRAQHDGRASPVSPSTPLRNLPTTPLGMGAGPALQIRASSSPAPGSATQPSTPLGGPSGTTPAAATMSSAAHGWAIRAAKGRERERERESDLRDWTLTRPILERSLSFDDVGVVWTETRARMAVAVRGMYLRKMQEARARVVALGAQVKEIQTASAAGLVKAGTNGDAEEAQKLMGQMQAQQRIVQDLNRLVAQSGRQVAPGSGDARFLGRYDFVDGADLAAALEYALETEPVDRLWTAIEQVRNGPGFPTSEAQREHLLRLSKGDVDELVKTVRNGVWGGTLGEAYTSSVARFIKGAQQSVHDFADVAADLDRLAEVEQSSAPIDDEVGPVEDAAEEECIPSTRRDYNDEDYLGGGLRVLLVPPREDLADEDAVPAADAS